MSAIDTFEWYVSSISKNPDPDVKRSIVENREYLLSLRSEDERRRFVEGLVEKLRQPEE